MLNEIEFDETLGLVEGIDIPARPAVLQEISALQESDNADMSDIAKVISQDVTLSAAVLKAVNAPLFGLPKKISSISQAAVLLGMNNVINIVMGVSLKLEISGRFHIAVERFWDTANDVALISAGIANQLKNVTPDQCYTLGLFHDCGIPLLIIANKSYIDILKAADSDPEHTIVEVEQEALLTSHTSVGYYVAKKWGLPRRIYMSILNHHERDMLSSDDDVQNNLIANLKMAEAISHDLRQRGDNPEWTRIRDYVLTHLELDLEDYEKLSDDMMDMIKDG